MLFFIPSFHMFVLNGINLNPKHHINLLQKKAIQIISFVKCVCFILTLLTISVTVFIYTFYNYLCIYNYLHLNNTDK